jgi:hypothetical protein
VKKSASIQVELGKEMEEVSAQVHPRRKTLARGIWVMARTVKRKLKNKYRNDSNEQTH